MERITISIEEDLLETLDALIARRGYATRSEAVRDLVRAAVAPDQTPALHGTTPDDVAPCLGTLSYVYDHARRELGRRLIETQHGRHDLTVATLHVHLDADSCLEVAILRGTAPELQTFADTVTTQRGVRYGGLHLIPAGAVAAGAPEPAAPLAAATPTPSRTVPQKR